MTCSISGPGTSCAPGTFTITAGDPNPDAQILLVGTPLLGIDFMDGWVDISFVAGVANILLGFGSSATLTLSGLLPPGGAETSLRDLSITSVTGLTAADFALAGGVLTIDLGGTSWNPALGSAVSFEVAVPVPVPVPAVLLLGGLAGLGLAARRRPA